MPPSLQPKNVNHSQSWDDEGGGLYQPTFARPSRGT